ncbi:glycosyltransferase family 2 protein [Acidipropionibacterium acidipropionici]|uniref:glycosyltransferase family 2 protein n=1 Tax=Acidipropionibacterium acidipropionici TaxID=1748 RepID=UPI0026B2EB35
MVIPRSTDTVGTTELPLISICVINYNGARYLSDTIRSIIGQTYPNIEIVFCDDASTDDSVQLFEELVRTSGRDLRVVRRYHTVNSGPELNILDGLRAFNGEYVCNVDGDDLLAPNHLETLYALATESGCDIACTSHTEFSDGDDVSIPDIETTRFSLGTFRTYSTERAIATFFLCDGVLPFEYWHRLYRRESSKVVSELPPELFCNSDSAFSVAQFCESRCVAYASIPTYFYRIRRDSVSHVSRYRYARDRTLGSLDGMTSWYANSHDELLAMNAHRNAVAVAAMLRASVDERLGLSEFRKCCALYINESNRKAVASSLYIRLPRGVRGFVRRLFPHFPVIYHLSESAGLVLLPAFAFVRGLLEFGNVARRHSRRAHHNVAVD